MQIRWMIIRLGVKDGGCMNNVNNDVSVLRVQRIREERSPHSELDGADRGLGDKLTLS